MSDDSVPLVATADGSIVDMIDVEFEGRLATTDTIAVLPDRHQRGVCATVLDDAIAIVPIGIAELDAWTRDDAATNAW